ELLQAELYARKSNKKAVAATAGASIKIILSPLAAFDLVKGARKSHFTFWNLQDIHVELANRNLKALPKGPDEHIVALALGQVAGIATGALVGKAVDASDIASSAVDGIVSHCMARHADKAADEIVGGMAENAVTSSLNKATKLAFPVSTEPPKPPRSPLLGFIRKPDAGPAFATDHLQGLWRGSASRTDQISAGGKFTVMLNLNVVDGAIVGTGTAPGCVLSGSVNRQGTEVTIVETDGSTEITYHGTIRGGVMRGNWETTHLFIEVSREEKKGTFELRHF
ncbi:hypothetical protein HDU97_002442, partial [Phlyctochytrium planicorne]